MTRELVAHGTDRLTAIGCAEALDRWEREDSELLWQAASRAEALLTDLEQEHPADVDLAGLLGYVREVVLARITDEEHTVLPRLRGAPGDHPEVEVLHEQHVRLRSDVEDLAAAAQHDSDPADLALIVRRLLARLEGHLATEAAILTGSGSRASGPAWAVAGHWYCLTEGPVVDMDQLEPHEAEAAVLNRLMRMQPDEDLVLRWTSDPQPLWQRLQQRDPGGYSWQATESSPGSWTVQVSRRTTP